jgi:AcrR family transcriptional regulator
MIASSASAHVALVNYHFGSKEMLFEAAVERRARRLADAWRAGLAELAADQNASTEHVLRAWWRPFEDLQRNDDLPWRNYLCVVARLAAAPDGNDWYQRYFGIVDRDFHRALASTLPASDHDVIDAGFRYARSLFGEVLLHRCGKAGGTCVPRGFRETDTDRLIGFVASGLRGIARPVPATTTA